MQSRNAKFCQALSCALSSAADLLSLIPLSHLSRSQSRSAKVNGATHLPWQWPQGTTRPSVWLRSQSCVPAVGTKAATCACKGCWYAPASAFCLAVSLRRCWRNKGQRDHNALYTYQGVKQESLTYLFISSLMQGSVPALPLLFMFFFSSTQITLELNFPSCE